MQMNTLIDQFPQQLEEAISIGEKAQLTRSNKDISNVVITGLGGSGIGGSLAKGVMSKMFVTYADSL